MSGSTNKRVRVVRFEREAIDGFVQPQTFQTDNAVEMISRDGNIIAVPFPEIKFVCFLQDFEDQLPDFSNRTFTSRPKSSGLWVRMTFRDGAILDGLLPNNLLSLDPHGFTVTPPGLSTSPQRIFVPSAALRTLHVLAVVGGSLGRTKKPDERQISIFET